AAPLAAEAQPATIARIGLIGPGPSRTEQGGEIVFEAFRERLKELGYVDGRNITFVRRWPEFRYERLQQLAQDLVSVNVDVIVAWSTPAILAAKRATTKTPIIMASSADAVATGLVESLAHPGGNVTGVSWDLAQLATRWVQIMLELRP